ncbi:hypothetical protein MKL09_04030 [Methylobacterium sp. J-048]|uniref:hypothetical protein n=1 Tax=Methylobacterium sp. J-048 TaxID=2836635 RepID=UPI001FB9E56B|nr:hypothetical protein [Methylobacterium sp. J-048]MCJ2055721.1 hypothetical protein [Methylobacterium sp. J-048]
MAKLTLVASFAILLGGTTLAPAQSFIAPGGEPAVVEPGGTEGRDGRRNVIEGIEDGEAVGVPPRAADGFEGERRVRSRRRQSPEDDD